MKRFCIRFLFFVCVVLFILFLISPDTVQKSAHESILFCAAVLIPSLFPGFVLSDLLLSLSHPSGKKDSWFSRIFGLPSVLLQCWIIGLLAGFPAAADCAAHFTQRGIVGKEDGARCLAFTNNPGIVFVVCAVGSGLFGSFSIGIYLWVIQTVSAFLVGILFANPKNLKHSLAPKTDGSQVSVKRVFPAAVVTSVSSVLNICGFVIFFRSLIDVVTCAIPLDFFRTVLAGLLEMTCGISGLSDFTFLNAFAASVMLGWSGCSVHFQILNVIASADLSARYYLAGKVLQTCFSAFLTAISYSVFWGAKAEHPFLIAFVAVLFFFLIIGFRLRKDRSYGKRKISVRKKPVGLRNGLY